MQDVVHVGLQHRQAFFEAVLACAKLSVSARLGEESLGSLRYFGRQTRDVALCIRPGGTTQTHKLLALFEKSAELRPRAHLCHLTKHGADPAVSFDVHILKHLRMRLYFAPLAYHFRTRIQRREKRALKDERFQLSESGHDGVGDRGRHYTDASESPSWSRTKKEGRR